MDPRIHLQDGEVLVFLAVVFFLGFATCWLLMWQTVRRLREQAKADARCIRELIDQVEAETGSLMADYRQAVSHVAQDQFANGVIDGMKRQRN